MGIILVLPIRQPSHVFKEWQTLVAPPGQRVGLSVELGYIPEPRLREKGGGQSNMSVNALPEAPSPTVRPTIEQIVGSGLFVSALVTLASNR